MTGDLEAFLDTNVLVYALSADEPAKHRRAQEIVERGFVEGCYAISTQVMLELYVTITRKIATRVPPREAQEFLRALSRWHVVTTDADLVLAGVDLAERVQISPWDGTILEAARRAGCARVLSEDLGDGHVYDGLTVENPF